MYINNKVWSLQPVGKRHKSDKKYVCVFCYQIFTTYKKDSTDTIVHDKQMFCVFVCKYSYQIMI